MTDEHEEIELKAVYRKSGVVDIFDQHGRKFKAIQPTYMGGNVIQDGAFELELEAPYWQHERPYAIIKIRVPLEVEERLPDWMQEFINR